MPTRTEIDRGGSPVDWPEFFGRYSTIALIANSEAAEVRELREKLPDDTLFIFFNEASRVLRTPFGAPSMLVARSGYEGPAIVRKGKMPNVLACFAPGALKAVVNLRCGGKENFVKAEDFGFSDVFFLDLTEYLATRYTAAKTASSGYGLVAWLIDLGLPCALYGCGFTGRRSERWKVFDVHDWALEQLALRLFETQGRIVLRPSTVPKPSAIEALSNQFPNVDRQRFAELGYEILAQRIEHTDMFVERLWSVTRVGRGVREAFKVFRKRKGSRL